MKKILSILMACLTAIFIFPPPAPVRAGASDFRAVWVSTAYNLDFPSKKNLSSADMKKEIDAVIDRAADMRLNAVVVQVRPAADALYPSEIFPWSEVLTGTQGQAPDSNFDPLAYWIERAHAKGLELHAWVNPFRVTYASAKITEPSQLSAQHPARENPLLAVAYKEALYFDPGRPESRQLIADGVAEILHGYSIDGIQLDDYFYPGTDFPDEASYQLYGGGDRAAWRRENVNTLVRLLQKTIKDARPNVRYGISPSAIWRNQTSDPLGSDTRGYEAYASSFADTRRWAREGWIDYICPQIYWHIGFDTADYAKLVGWWENVCQGTGVDLYIGHAAYREDESAEGWTPGELTRQLTLNSKNNIVRGDIFFRFAHIKGVVGDRIRDYYQTKDNAPASAAPTSAPADSTAPSPTIAVVNITQPITAVPAQPAAASAAPAQSPAGNPQMDKLTVAKPSGDISVTDAGGYNILGTFVPGKPLYINGQAVENKTAEGFFSAYVPLKTGTNTFTLTQEGQTAVTRVITAKVSAPSAPAVMKTPAVTNMFPSAETMASPGDRITLRCTAPAGAAVTAQINGESIPLKQDNDSLVNGGGTVYAASYSASYTVPPAASGVISDWGKPSYTAVFNGQRYSASAGEPVKVIGAEAPYYATVVADSAWMFPNATSNGGSSWPAVNGQQDRVTAVSGDWVRLASGGWVEASSVTREMKDSYQSGVIGGARYFPGADEDIIIWKAAHYPGMHVSYDGETLTVRFGMQKTAPGHAIDINQTMFSHLQVSSTDNAPRYVFTLREGARLEGYYLDYAGGELRLHLRKQKSLAAGSQPLKGFSFVLDAGHGGTDPGATGPMGGALPEKVINLANAQKVAARLRGLGAAVTMVRDGDDAYSTYQRTEISRKALPDLFISIHGNSLAETTDASSVRGLTVWYRNPNSAGLADTLMDNLHSINPGTTRQPVSNQSNFYVCRPPWAPSVIVEASFLCNIYDFAWMINDAQQNELAAALAQAVVDYYR